MMFVMAEKEEVKPSQKDLEKEEVKPSQKDLKSPKDELQSPTEYHTPKDDHGTPRCDDEISQSPGVFLTPNENQSPKIPDQFEKFCDDGKEKREVDEIPRAAGATDEIPRAAAATDEIPRAATATDEIPQAATATDEIPQAATATDEIPRAATATENNNGGDNSENDEILGEEDADSDATENDEIGGGDVDADLVDSLLQEEEDHDLDSPVSREHHNEDKDQEAVTVEMKMRKRKALLEFRCKVEDAIRGNYLLGNPSESDDPIEVAMGKEKLRDIALWGIPLLPSKSHLGSDIVLLKFLKARDFKVEEAYEMLRKTVIWRKELNVEGIMEEELETEDLRQMAYTNSVGRKGHPLCYNLYGPFKDKKMHNRVFGTEKKRKEYLRWRVQCMEKAIRQLSFKPGNVDSIIVITDLGNSPGPALKEIRALCKDLISLFQDYYPEFVFRNLVVNIPFWYYVSHAVHSKFGSQGTKKNFIFSRPSKTTDTLLKYINAENLPIQYGGLQRQNDQVFTDEDKVKLLVVKPNTVGTVEVPVSEGGMTVDWDVTVVGWEVSYKEEFIPYDEGSYRVLIQKEKKLAESVRNLSHIREPGRIELSFINLGSKKKKVLYRTKCSPTPINCPKTSN